MGRTDCGDLTVPDGRGKPSWRNARWGVSASFRRSDLAAASEQSRSIGGQSY